MQNNGLIAIFFIVLFFMAYFLFGFWLFETTGKINNSQDFLFHFEKAQGKNVGEYKPVYHSLFSFFSKNEFLFYSANLFLVMAIIPFALFFLCRSFWVVLIYFCGVSFPHLTMFSATFPAALMVLLFLFYLELRKRLMFQKIYICIGFIVIAGMVHSFGSALFVAVLIAELISTFWIAFEIKKLVKSCVPLLNNASPAVVLSPGYLKPEFKIFQNIFLNLLPLQTVYFALQKMDLFFFLICAASVFGMLTDIRAIIIPQIICCICASDCLEKKEWKTQRLYIFFLMIQCCFYLVFYLSETLKVIIWN